MILLEEVFNGNGADGVMEILNVLTQFCKRKDSSKHEVGDVDIFSDSMAAAEEVSGGCTWDV